MGSPGIRIDGNDVFAAYAAARLAADRARSGDGPTLIEGLTYRLGAHTTSDDPTKYRSDEEVKLWETRDPLLRLERYLLRTENLTAEEAVRLREQSLACAQAAYEEVEQEPDEALDDTFRYHYSDLPTIMERQLERRKA